VCGLRDITKKWLFFKCVCEKSRYQWTDFYIASIAIVRRAIGCHWKGNIVNIALPIESNFTHNYGMLLCYLQ